MNMKLKRILSSVLVVIMLFSAIAILIPVEAKAAHHSSVSDTRLTTEEAKKIVEEYQKASFSSAEELFQSDLEKGRLDYSTNGNYTIYVNRYTGVMYYRNNLTGEMLTSNSYNFEGAAGAADELTSQIMINYAIAASSDTPTQPMYSSTWAAKFNQITVTKIDNGLKVSYAIGDTATRCLLPVVIEVSEFENDILRPMFETLYNMMLEELGEEYAINYFDESGKYYNQESIKNASLLHTESIRKYSNDFSTKITAYQQYMASNNLMSADVQKRINKIDTLMNSINTLFYTYQPYNPTSKTFKYTENVTPAITLKGYSVYAVKDTTYSQMAVKAKIIQNYCPEYTFDMMYEDELYCEYEHQYEAKPVFRCSLEYTFNEDGTLSVRLPSNSIVFDETEYILKSITPLQFFGAANFQNDGYLFLPDGSGSIIEFGDFRSSNVALSSALSFYGNDFCYSEITGAHKQPLTMPVYGVASTKDPAGNKVGLGYFAILEEGSSMAQINVKYASKSFREGTIYTTFTPYPTDRFDLSDTVSVGGNTSYTIVSESKYSGSYVTRYVMLSDNCKYNDQSYSATYIGMASYYRNYLVANGTLTALENTSNDLPLYLEALGSLEVVEKILTFPVNVSKPITTFEDIASIYKDLGNAKQKMLDKAAEYDALAAAEEDNHKLRDSYKDIADNYRRLAEEVVNIDNVNFKLTGFANGGLYSTYPAKLKWERVVGGKRGFKNLLKTAAENTDADSNFGVYPDFDFQYINNTAAFDKVGKRNTVSRMVDNRYASKQVYSSVDGEFDTIYAMIISADSLDRLYDKFIKKYDNYDATGISVSTLGSDLNSNFDKKNPISRDDAQGYVTALLDRIANESNYSVMINQGNIYAVKYADHILGVCTDSSYYRYSSYTIPFIGMILHGYVNYTGTALNYSGSPDYDILRAIENGASIYYVIGYQNTDLMKDDEEFNKYYSVSYENWFDDIVEKYALINAQIGDLQNYNIVGHETLIGERVIDESEQIANLEALKNEFISEFRKALEIAIDAKLVELRQDNDYAKRIGVSADIDALVAIAHEMFELSESEQLPPEFKAALEAVLAEFRKEYDTTGVDASNVVTVSVDTLDYESKYQYVTGSTARDDNYEYTDYTADNDLIVMVTYQDKDGNKRSFILNYNIYAVEVVLEEGAEPITIEKYSFARIDY